MESDKQEVWEMTFADWVAAGAIFGIKAFFAVVTFGLFALALLGFVAVLGAVTGKGGDKDDMDRR